MKNQVLSTKQMQKLKELGVDINKASMCYISKYPSCDFDDGDSIVVVSKDFNKRLYNEFGPAFTLQDIIELLPKTFMDDINKFHLTISTVDGASIYIVGYVYDEDVSIDKKYFCNESIINAAYDMLIWIIENEYLKTK